MTADAEAPRKIAEKIVSENVWPISDGPFVRVNGAPRDLERLADAIAAALTATHEAAERGRDEARHALRQYQDAWDIAVKDKHAAERERVEAIQKLNAERVECGAALTALAQARAALRKWGQHATYCTWHININTCNCEFGALLTTGGGSE
jgi:uncharacterized membrane protein